MDVTEAVRWAGDSLYWGHRWAELPIHAIAIAGVSKLIRSLSDHDLADVLVDVRRLLACRMVYIAFLLWFWSTGLPVEWRWVAGWLVGGELAFIAALAATLTPWREITHRVAILYVAACALGLAASLAALWWVDP